MDTSDARTVVVRRTRGRPPAAPATALARFVADRLRELGLSRRELAARLHTSQATVSRLLSGKTTAARGITESRLAEALELTGMNRREFLRRARAATALTLAVSTTTLKHQAIDLDQVEDRVQELYQLMRYGEARMVLDHAQRWQERLDAARLSPTDPQAAAARRRVGLVLGAAQEAIIPWFQRAPAILHTYERVARETVFPFALHRVAFPYAQILERMAPLCREAGDYERGIAFFDEALACLAGAPGPDRPDLDAEEVLVLQSGLLRNRAHIRAVQGNEAAWRRDIEAAYRVAERTRPAQRDLLRALILYGEGEGYKRLAYLQGTGLAESARQGYARRALAAFDQERPLRAGQWYSHDLIARVAEAQCLVWLDPAEALRQSERLREVAERISPGMLPKVERTASHARQRLNAQRSDGLPVLRLDHSRAAPARA